MATGDGSWTRRLTSTVGAQVKRYRDRSGWSARELADRCEQVGHRIEAQVIANMETGRRANVPAAEVVVLAAALGVPPVCLLFPIETGVEVEVVPGIGLEAWLAAQWFNGGVLAPEITGRDTFLWDAATDMLHSLREHDLHVVAWERAAHVEERAEREENDAETVVAREQARQKLQRATRDRQGAERAIREVRRLLRSALIVPPSLPANVEHVDTGSYDDPAIDRLVAGYRETEER